MRKGCLEGIKVLDLSHFVAGPFCGQLLGDLGADVIKLERPGAGEAGRMFEPFSKGESVWYCAFNRNKKGITLDIRSAEGKEVFLKLVEKVDVLIENLRPGSLDKMGLGFEKLRSINPGLVMVSISGFGLTGPNKFRPALDQNVQAISGLMHMTGFPDGPPTRAGVVIVDFLAGIYGALGAVSALLHREITGKGQHVDAAMFDAATSILEYHVISYLLLGIESRRAGNSRYISAPNNTYQVKDGVFFLAAPSNALFARLAQLIGKPELTSKPEYSTAALRKKNEAELDNIIQEWLREKTMEDVEKELVQAGIPCGPVNSIGRLVNDINFKERGLTQQVDHPVIGPMQLQKPVLRFSETESNIRLHPPLLGEHNEEIYGKMLGIESRKLEMMKKGGII